MAVKRRKKKKWLTIVAPEYLNKVELGETLVSEPENALGRTVEVSVVDVTNDFSKYYMKIAFRINKVENDIAYTEFERLECLRDYIARMILRRVTRIDSIQDLTTKDGVKLRVKALVVVYRKVTRATQKDIRNKVSEMVRNFIENSTIDKVVENILNDSWKKEIIKEASKIYPIRYFEFRKVEVLRK